jgi:ATP/maltotriose-dependent transcriptional regulator MalT
LSFLGSVLTWHGELGEARRVHEEALASAARQGSPGARARALVELGIIAMREGDVEAVRELTAEGLTAAAGGEWQHATGAAIALQAWVAWRDRRLEAAIELARRALERGSSVVGDSGFQFLALWPLVGAHLELGQLEEALAAARRMLDPSQARLPDELEAALHEACESWERADAALARRQLYQSLQLARDLGYA